MVEVFKTSVEKAEEAAQLSQTLLKLFPLCKINFDLNDCDKILRIEGKEIQHEQIIKLMKSCGFMCEILK